MESQDRLPDRLRQRTHWPAADLYHGSRRYQRAAPYRSRLRGFSQLVAERTISDFLLDAQIRAGRTGLQRSLLDGRRQQAVGATHARLGSQRLSLLVAGWAAHRVSVTP